MPVPSSVPMEFHISRQARDRYQFDESLFSLTGSLIVANPYAARVIAQKMNEQRDLVRYPERAVRAGQISAMGLIDEFLHYVVRLYREQENPRAIEMALSSLEERLGRTGVDAALAKFAQEFPPLAVYRRQISTENYLEGQTAGTPHREVLLEEMLMLWLTNANPACSPYKELYDDTSLRSDTPYEQIMSALYAFFDGQPGLGSRKQNLIDVLREPALASPDSLEGQLAYIRERWGHVVGPYLYRLLGSLDLISEESKVTFQGPGPAQVPDWSTLDLELEPEGFSPDSQWMPNVVLMAKNAYVWLYQLSRKHGRAITRLDQIPDEELDALARWGFTGLWLIGLWERSRASQKIKQMCGNPEAVASAYSLYDYRVADDLGGEGACQDLRNRAWQRGIRLASDMVPNHMGIDSPWVVEHPDWFIGSDHCPFPSYTFNGPNLSADDRVEIRLEDHYYDRGDAAVVFKRVDRWTGSERYIYHGNDGTTMPWNDTAQLDYLNPRVREAMSDQILRVAGTFPIIRFDAAMTLAKRHYQRLWFPEPGTGGDIASRAEHAMTKERFDALMPNEFWREVVDRMAQEAPDTLLLAEAFWLMEGYFVRTLGMHRVYNSAFMNMLRDEKNAEYRLVIKNTLEFDPRILERYVNFMNNPDERTAVDQFGKDDKYIGVCTMLATMPGLPMFGHGQIEGFTEKYGMEYRRAYRDETPDAHLVTRHEREIFPLLRRRHLFAQAENFRLYDLQSVDGSVNEDVYAYSNRVGQERALVIYHNRYAEARGTIRTSAAYSVAAEQGDERVLAQRSLGQSLLLHDEPEAYCIFRDHVAGLEYIRSSRQLSRDGLYIELGAYKVHVFLDWHEVWDDERHLYRDLMVALNGRGVPSIDEALQDMALRPVHEPFKELVNAGMFGRLIEARVTVPGDGPDARLMGKVEQLALRLLGAVNQREGGRGDERLVARQMRQEAEAILRLPIAESRIPTLGSPEYWWAAQQIEASLEDEATWGVLLGWLFTHALGKVVQGREDTLSGRAWFDAWRLGKILSTALREMGLEEERVSQSVGAARVLASWWQWFQPGDSGGSTARDVLEAWLGDVDIARFLGVNRHEGVLWYHKESFEGLITYTLLLATVEALADTERPTPQVIQELADRYDIVSALQRAEEQSEYQVEKLLEAAKG